uniref:Uncharacterized protein n=1 Tax=Hyaloperonospora arabidopsidis (strain Emoy2) TaxID=559515 RepID=M4B603_HYAAE
MREHRGAKTVVQVAQLHACFEKFTLEWSVKPLILARCQVSPPRLSTGFGGTTSHKCLLAFVCKCGLWGAINTIYKLGLSWFW